MPKAARVAILACLAAAGWSLVHCGSDDEGAHIPAPPDGGPSVQNTPDADLDSGQGNNPVSGENLLPGTTEYVLDSPATQREIEGYASLTSVAPGEKISIFVNTASPKYTMAIYRLGWYGGQGGRLLQPAIERDGHTQVTPTPDNDGLVECNWTDPYDLTIPSNWVTGYYLVKLTTQGTKKQAYVPFIVRDDARIATYLVQSSVTTFQAYNNWGGKSLYDYNSTDEERATRVSFLRPYGLGDNPESAAGLGAGEIITNLQGAIHTGPMGWEQSMLRFLERYGYDVSYATNIDVDRDPDLVGKHKVFVSVGHDEYWSTRARDHVEYARDHSGTSLAMFSGNVSYWQTQLQPSKGGQPSATIFCAKDATLDPASISSDFYKTTVRFSEPLLNRTEAGLGGVQFQDYDIFGDLVVSSPTNWVFNGAGVTMNQHIPSLLGYEVEGMPAPPVPGTRALAVSPWTTDRASAGSANMAVHTLPSGAETFAAGSIQFAWGLDDYRPPGISQPSYASPAIQQMARNILVRFGSQRTPNRSPVFLDDPFTNDIDGDVWEKRTITEGAAAFDPAVAVTGTGGHVTIAPKANTAGLHHGGIVSARTFPMMCGSVRAEVSQATSAPGATTTLAIAVDTGHYYRMTEEGGTLSLESSAGGGTNVAYNAVQQKNWRIRHDCPNDRIVFETSPDGTSWTVRNTIARSIDLHAAFVELEAGTYQSVAGPGSAVFDNVHVEAAGVMDTFNWQRDPELWTPDSVHEGGYDPELAVFPIPDPGIDNSGKLHLRARGNIADAHHLGFLTSREFDWTGGVAMVTIVQQPNPATEASVSLAILPQVAGWARMTVSAGKLFFQQEINKARDGGSIAFDPVNHKHLRIRHAAASNELVWETSPDGATWTERRRAAAPFPVNAMRAEIETGTYQAETNPGEALVDDFVFAK